MARARRPVAPPVGGSGSSPLRPPPLKSNIGYINTGFVPSRVRQWNRYTPTWRGLTADPSLGNGTLVGWYRVVDRWVEVEIELVTGSTTTYGTGGWYFANTPLAPLMTRAVGIMTVYDTSATATYAGWVQARSNGQLFPATPSTATSGAMTSLTATAPVTFATGDELWMSVRYRYRN